MKITKKQPLKPRGRSEEKRQSTKNAIVYALQAAYAPKARDGWAARREREAAEAAAESALDDTLNEGTEADS